MTTINDWIFHVGLGLLVTIVMAIFVDMGIVLFITTVICGVIGAWIGRAMARSKSARP